MRIAVDVARLRGPRTGIARVVESLVEAAGRAGRHAWIPVAPAPGRRRLAWLLRDLPRAARRAGADAILCPHVWDFPGPTRLPIVAVVHDVWPLLHPDPRDPHAWRHRLLKPVTRAAAIAFDSRWSEAESRRFFRPRPGVPTAVVPPGVGPIFGPTEAAAAGAARRPGLPPGPYLLAVASDDARKNLPFLARLVPRLPAPVVVVGDIPADRVPGAIRLGVVDDADLAALYRDAAALLFPSTYEGFGLPALEAAACGCPVVAAATSTLPEVLGGGYPGLLSLDEDRWLDLARALVEDAALRAAFRDAGLRRAAAFSWDRTVEGIEALIDAAGAGRRRPATAVDAPTVLFDGTCRLCDRWARWLGARDRRRVLRFESIESEAGRRLRASSGVPPEIDSVVLIDADGAWTHSTAVLRALRHVGAPWSAVSAALAAVPRPARDAAYRFLARRRHALSRTRTDR